MSEIAVVNEDGEVGTLPAEQARQGFATGALRPANVEQIRGMKESRRVADVQAKYGGFTGGAAATGLGVLRGASLGLSDPLITGAAKLVGGQDAAQSVRDTIRGTQEANPILSTVGEVGGMVAPALLSGGTSVAAEAGVLGKAAVGTGQAMRIAGAPVRALTAAGGLAENTIARGLGGGTMAKIAGKAATAGAEGAIFGASRELSNQLTEEAIGNPALNAERIFAAAGHDLVMGTALGGGAGVLSAIAGKGTAALSRVLSRKSTVDALDDFAGSQAWRAAGGTQKMAERANKFAGGTENVGRMWMDEARTTFGKSFDKMTREELPALAEAIKRKHGGMLDDLVEKADEIRARRGMAIPTQDYLESVAERAVQGVKGEFGVIAEKQKIVNFVKELMDEAGSIDGLTLRNLRDMRIGADKRWAGNKLMPDVANPMKAVRDVIEGDVVGFMESASHSAPRNFAAEYKAAKQGWQAGEILNKASARGVAASSNNQFLSLTDKITAGMGGTVGGVLGGMPGMVVGNVLSGVASKMVRAKFPFVAAEYSQQAARMLDISRASMSLDKAIETKVRGLLGGQSITVRSIPVVSEVFGAAPAPQQTRAHKSIERVHQLATDMAHVDSRVGHIAQYAPKHGAAMAAQYTKTLGYLSANAPKPMNSSMQLGGGGKPMYSARDIAQWGKLLKVAANPLTILESPTTVDTASVRHVKALYPELYRTIQNHIAREVLHTSGKKSQASLQTRVQIAQIFAIPYPLTNPNFVARVSRPRTERTGGDGMPKQGQAHQAQALSKALQTDTERLR